MPISLASKFARELHIETDNADQLKVEVKHAVIMGTGRSLVCWSHLHKSFIAAPLGHHLMDIEQAEEVARTVGGAIVDVVVKDVFGPCCYRLENAS